MSYGMASPTGLKAGSSPTGGGNKIPKGYSQGQMQQFTPEQMQLFQQMFSQIGPESFTSKLAGGDEDMFNQMEAPALKQFAGLQGQMASRFSGMGMGGRKSSGFQNSMGQMGSDFAQQLQARRMELQQGAIKDLMGMSSNLLGQRPYEQFLTEKPQKQNPWADIAGKFAGAIPGAVASYMNPASGLSNFGDMFNGGNNNGYNFKNEMQSGSGYNY